jgi:hypothetical protein
MHQEPLSSEPEERSLSPRRVNPCLRALQRTIFPLLAVGFAAAVSAGCGSDSVAYIMYPVEDDGGVDSASGSSGGDDTSSSSGVSSSSGGSGSGSSSSGGPSTSSGGDAGPCDLTGYWIAVQHSVVNALMFKEIGIVDYYYDLTQTGTTVKVNHGLHCGFTVVKSPDNLAGGGDSVSLPSAGPALIARQDEGMAYGSQPARTGTMTMTSSGCQFHLNKYYTIRGATLGYFDDPSKAMSATMSVASGCGANFSSCTTPGSEDWDNDGNPGITLSVAGTATGNIYASERDFSEFYGTVPLGASRFEVGVVDTSGQPAVGPEQYALGYGGGCTTICSTGSANDSCPASGCAAEYFVDFVRLDSPPGSSNTDICAYVVKNAPTLAPRAVDPHDVPTEPKYQ